MRFFNYKQITSVFACAILLLSSQNAHAYLLAPEPPGSPKIVCCSSVIFLPGIEGSRLYKKGTTENQLWEPNLSPAVQGNGDVRKLFLDEHGKSADQTIYTRDIISRTNIGLGLFDIDVYKKISDQLDLLVASGTIKEWKARPYDWRLNPDDVVDSVKLEQEAVSISAEIKDLATRSKNGKVIIIAHSNGGLIAKKVISQLESEGKEGIVESLVLAAVPQLGTPEALATMLHGDGQQILGGLILSNKTAKEWVEHMPTAYNLLPSVKYFVSVDQSLVIFDASSSRLEKFFNTYEGKIDSYQKMNSFVTASADGRKKEPYTEGFIPNVGSQELLNKSKTFHDQFDDYPIPAPIRVIQLVGQGLPTVRSIRYTPENPCELTPALHFCVIPEVLDRQPVMTTNGDGTVVAESAHAAPAETYFVDLYSSNKDRNQNLSHATFFENDSVIDLINQVINQKSEIGSSYVSLYEDTFKNKSFYETSVHSPVSIGVTHSDGKGLSVSAKPTTVSSDFTLVDQSIPNSKYMNFGEGKYIWTSEPEVVSMHGQELGTFTVDVKKLQGDSASEIKTWQDVPVASTSVATLDLKTIDASIASSSLKIDINGDGIFDVSLNNDSSNDFMQTLLFFKAMLNQVDVSTKIKASYQKRIDTIIKQVQTNKLKLAKQTAASIRKALLERIRKPEPKKPKQTPLSKEDAQDLLDMINAVIDKM